MVIPAGDKPALKYSDPLTFRSPVEINRGEGLGIVIPGGGIYLRSSWVTVRMVRHFGCDWPIELWLLPWEKITDRERFAFSLYDVEVRIAEPGFCLNEKIQSARWGKPIWLAGWQLKAQSVLQSQFRKVLFLDSDCYPIEHGWVERLTQYPGGTFLGDIVESESLLTSEACQSIGLNREMPVDSGAFYVDKEDSRWCEIVGHLNGPAHVRESYDAWFGEKDHWWAAHRATGTPFRTLTRGKVLDGFTGIRHSVGLLHRTGVKFTDGIPSNTPQRYDKQQLEGDDLTSRFLRSWPPLAVRNRRDWELTQSVIELDEYRLESLDPQEWVVDAGAHIGSFSSLVQRKWPKARILAIEPDEGNAGLFCQNSSAYLSACALGSSPGRVSLHCNEGDTAYATTKGNDVLRQTLSGLLDRFRFPRVDLLKIDIEGDEEGVFCELAESGWLRRITRIVGEWHDSQRLCRMMELLRKSHHLQLYVHHWNHGYFEAQRNDQA